LTVGGCACPTSGSCSAVSYSDIPADNRYYVTTFGGGGDTQGMACGGTADGTWAYVADSARFGCGAKLIISAAGKQCVAQVADCGPNRCVEQAASSSGCASHFPIIDASPYITKYLLGASGVGWSDKKIVTAVVATASATVGCPGVAPAADSSPIPVDSGPAPAKDTGSSALLDTGSSVARDTGSSAAKDTGSSAARDVAWLPGDVPGPAADGPRTGVGANSLAGGCAVTGARPVAPAAPLPIAVALFWLFWRCRARQG